MINSDQIHVAMTKTCGLVVTLACQSNTFYSKNKRKKKDLMADLRTNEYALLDFFSLEAEMLGRMLSTLMYGYVEFRHKK